MTIHTSCPLPITPKIQPSPRPSHPAPVLHEGVILVMPEHREARQIEVPQRERGKRKKTRQFTREMAEKMGSIIDLM